MPQETYLERKLRQLGLSQDHNTSPGSTTKRLTFRLYFPRPPYGPVEYLAAKQGDGLNFVGQLLGHGGSTLKRIQTESGTRVEVHDGKGNLNGTHPSYTDPSLHAVVFAESKDKLNKAAKMIAEVLSPVNGTFERFEVVSGSSAILRPALKHTESSSSNSCGDQRSAIDENDSCQATDLDSAFVQESSTPTESPWRKLKRYEEHSPLTVKPDPNEKVGKEEEREKVAGLKEWNTWGQNSQDGYSQFTNLTQTCISHYAKQSRLMKKNYERRFLSENGLNTTPPRTIGSTSYLESNHQHQLQLNPSPWSPNLESTFSGDGYTSHYGAAYTRSNGTTVRTQGLSGGMQEVQQLGLWENVPEATESCPLPNLYEDLTGGDNLGSKMDDLSLTGSYHGSMMLESDYTTNNTNSTIYQRVSLPHNI